MGNFEPENPINLMVKTMVCCKISQQNQSWTMENHHFLQVNPLFFTGKSIECSSARGMQIICLAEPEGQRQLGVARCLRVILGNAMDAKNGSGPFDDWFDFP